MDSMFSLTGRVAVVSGAAQGLGRAAALALAHHGADLVLVDRNQSGAEATATQIQAIGRKTLVAGTDVSSPEAIAELFQQVDALFGRVDFLGNIAGDGHLAKPEELTITDLHRVLQNLVVGRFAMCQEAGRRMLAQGRGSIMNIGSLASSTALGRGHIAYSMAMGAVIQMTRELSTEWSYRGVRVNCVTPAQVVNPKLEARMADDPTLEGRFLRGIPAGRLGQPKDIMGLAVLLASDASQWITGAIIPMDGGNMAMNAGGTPGHEKRGVGSGEWAMGSGGEAMSGINSYRDLEVWKLSMQLAKDTYSITRDFPKEELYGLTSQIRRASVSVPANIAEGNGRANSGDYARFLQIAQGSLKEKLKHCCCSPVKSVSLLKPKLNLSWI